MSRLQPIVFPLIATVSWGTNAVAGRILVGGGYIDGVSLTFVRFALATPLILLAASALGEKVRGEPRDVAIAAILGLLGVSGFNVFFYTALGYMEAALVSLITSLITPMTYIAGVILGMDKLDTRGVAGVLLAVGGTYLVLNPGSSSINLIGALLAFGAALSWTVYTLAVKGVASRMGPTAALFWSSLLGTLVVAPLSLEGLEHARITYLSIALIVYVAIVPGAVGYAAWNLGVKLSGPVLPSIFIPLVPLTATILAWILLGEVLTPIQVLGGLLIVIGIILVVTRRV
ncbi:MAG: DMT family transporter [Desulfurococcales archaeon]|nr:DMT family transporter [Desulfurococcales archaeon]